ncbi:F-box/FBD/LRR-repeat protein [Striga hermonthica]|uniref:F-box/FBD/LRR-repeat protein n=1 Tax=Striga hermonthica TaxID=68872 RepID=A0A9N7RN12_STRHE|nr:F-box/FBD/LRR-repeat protein [Striga hermonthica]
MEDRISELPIPILHHIFCFLTQKEAVKTCVLSKQWRHLGSTRPNLDFSQEWFNNTNQKIFSVVERTLQRCRDESLPIHELRLDVTAAVSFLGKSVPIVDRSRVLGDHLPVVVVNLEYLHIGGCLAVSGLDTRRVLSYFQFNILFVNENFMTKPCSCSTISSKCLWKLLRGNDGRSCGGQIWRSCETESKTGRFALD